MKRLLLVEPNVILASVPYQLIRVKLPDVRGFHRRARRLARWSGSIAYRSIVVPLLDQEETEHALDLACRLAADRGARVVLVAPAGSSSASCRSTRTWTGTLMSLKERLEVRERRSRARTVSRFRREIVRTRPGSFGEEVARVAAEHRAELVVVGAPVESRRGFHRAFPREILLLLREAPCRVMIATGPVAGSRSDRGGL